MADVFKKVDDKTVKKVYQKEETYNIRTLEKREEILLQELDKVQNLIREAKKLGIKTT